MSLLDESSETTEAGKMLFGCEGVVLRDSIGLRLTAGLLEPGRVGVENMVTSDSESVAASASTYHATHVMCGRNMSENSV